MKRYWNYWAKADAQQKSWHPLICHSLDTAAVVRAIIESSETFFSQWAYRLEMSFDVLLDSVCFLSALHDLGKFSLEFQAKVPDLREKLHGPIPPHITGYHHPTAALILWNTVLEDMVFTQYQIGGVDAIRVRRALEPWVVAAFGHHGGPVQEPSISTQHTFSMMFDEEAITAATDFVFDMIGLFPGFDALMSEAMGLHRHKSSANSFSFIISGLIILSDWSASATTNFPFAVDGDHREYSTYPSTEGLSEYFRVAMELAQEAIVRQGLVPAVHRMISDPWNELFPELSTLHAPSLLQQIILGMDLKEEPGLYIIEDLTGSGKTEAALMLYARLQRSGADGFYFALPTMATSNGMYDRIREMYRTYFTPGATVSLVLAHGASHLHEGFQESTLLDVSNIRYDEDTAEDDVASGEISYSSSANACSEWIEDSSKKAFLAQVGVGTIDQALLSVLYSRHNSLRMYGLAQKIVIVDEVHAYDLYMQGLIHNLLKFLAAQHKSVVLLSATLPLAMKEELVNSYVSGLSEDGKVDGNRALPSDEFPLISIHHQREDRYLPVAVAPGKERSINLRFFTTPNMGEPLEFLAKVSRSGRCGVWICNTVKDAQQAYSRLKAHIGTENVLLFHSRFTMADRQAIEQTVMDIFGKRSGAERRRGKILIATQVVEQSLDLDFDEMVSDLCPIDLLIQRSGRLKRHVRDSEGNPITGSTDGRGAVTLSVFGPAPHGEISSSWYSGFFPAGSYVYEDPSILWKTAVLLREEGSIRVPERSRHLIESVYGASNIEVPEALHKQSELAQREGQRASAIAQNNIVPLDRGFVQPGDLKPWPDHAAPTRLTDEAIAYRLCLKVQGALQAIVKEGKNRWAMSEVRYRKMPLIYDPAIRQLMEKANKAFPDKGRAAFLLPMEEWGRTTEGVECYRSYGVTTTGRHLLYDSVEGLRMEQKEEL